MKYIQIICAVLFLLQNVENRGLNIEFSWSAIDYTWTSADNDIPTTISNDPNAYDTYIYENNVPMGANKWKNKMFVTVPRRRAGVPSTLNYVWLNGTQRHNVPLTPYPNWKTNRRNALNDKDIHFVSIYRTVVDECDRLWAIDDGRIESFGPTGSIFRIQNPSLVVIDLNTDTIIRRYFLKDSDLRPSTSVVNLAVDVEPHSCDDAYVYIPDMLGYGLIVYSFAQNDSWRMSHKYFHIESMSGDMHVAGMSFQWMDGIFSIDLTNKNADGFRTAYFHAMAGTHLFSVSTRILRSKELSTRIYHGTDLKIVFNKGRNTDSSSSDLHKPTGAIFFGLINQNALGCWNINKRKSASKVDVVYRDNERFIYPSDVKVTKNEVIAVSNRFPVFAYVGLNYSDTNFRVFVANVYEALKYTHCD